MGFEVSIEVDNGQHSAWIWYERESSRLLGIAVEHGATDWNTVPRDWGVVLELAFPDEDAWARFLADAVVQSILDQAPDPVGGLHFVRGWGGAAGTREPIRPRPFAGAGAAEVPLPPEPPAETLTPLVLQATP